MKLFSLVASALGLGHVAAQDSWQDPSDADVTAWRSDVLGAESTARDIQTDACKVPDGTDLRQLGDPTKVSKNYSRLDDGNVRATYQFMFADGTLVYAGNSNAGMTGGEWQIFCFRAGNDIATRNPLEQTDLDGDMTTRLEQIFRSIDTDGSGTITTGGAYTGLSQVFPPDSIPDFENTLEAESIRAAGTDNVVDLDEFECVAKKLMNIQQVYNEFKGYDENNDLTMDRDELRDALSEYYFSNVADASLIQTAELRSRVEGVVDDIITHHDKDGDGRVSWDEFEMDTFMEENYQPEGRCRTSATPLNEHAITVVNNLIQKFQGNPDTNMMTRSMWYQIVNILTEQAIDMANGDAPAPPIGCMNLDMGTDNNGGPPGGMNGGGDSNNNGGPQRVGDNGGQHFGYTPQPGSGLLGGRRVLLARFLQGRPGGNSGGFNGRGSGMGPPGGDNSVSEEDRMTIFQALQALRQEADTNGDGMISDNEILDIFQGVKDHVSDEQFEGFLGAVDNLTGPIMCEDFGDCNSCTAVDNAGLCGWFPEATDTDGGNPFGWGGWGGGESAAGTCQFVDRSTSYAAGAATDADSDASDAWQMETCSSQCRMQIEPYQANGNFRGTGVSGN